MIGKGSFFGFLYNDRRIEANDLRGTPKKQNYFKDNSRFAETFYSYKLNGKILGRGNSFKFINKMREIFEKCRRKRSLRNETKLLVKSERTLNFIKSMHCVTPLHNMESPLEFSFLNYAATIIISQFSGRMLSNVSNKIIQIFAAAIHNRLVFAILWQPEQCRISL